MNPAPTATELMCRATRPVTHLLEIAVQEGLTVTNHFVVVWFHGCEKDGSFTYDVSLHNREQIQKAAQVEREFGSAQTWGEFLEYAQGAADGTVPSLIFGEDDYVMAAIRVDQDLLDKMRSLN